MSTARANASFPLTGANTDPAVASEQPKSGQGILSTVWSSIMSVIKSTADTFRWIFQATIKTLISKATTMYTKQNTMSRLIAGGRTSPYRALNGNPSLNSYAGAGNATASQPTTAAYSNLFRTPGSPQMGAQNNPTYNSGPPGYQGIAGTGGLYNQLQNASVTQGNAAAQSFFLPGDGSTPEDRFQTARQLMTDLNGKQRQGVIQPTDVQAWVPLLNKLKLKKLPDNPTAESAQRLNPILDQLDGLAQQGNIPSA